MQFHLLRHCRVRASWKRRRESHVSGGAERQEAGLGTSLIQRHELHAGVIDERELALLFKIRRQVEGLISRQVIVREELFRTYGQRVCVFRSRLDGPQPLRLSATIGENHSRFEFQAVATTQPAIFLWVVNNVLPDRVWIS